MKVYSANDAALPALNPRQLQLVERACQWMTRDLSAPITLQQVCQAVGASRSKLSTLFRLRCGCGAMSWLRDQKIQHACQLLEQSDKSVYEIAYELGFYDSAFFCKSFKSKYAMSPTQYRKNNRKQ